MQPPIAASSHRFYITSRIESKVLLVLAGTVLTLVLAGYMVYRTSIESARAAAWVSHSQQVRAELSQYYAALLEAQDEQKNFLFTGRPEVKAEYRRLAGLLDGRAQFLAKLVADDLQQLASLSVLKGLTQQRITLLERRILLFEQQGLLAAVNAGELNSQSLELIERIKDQVALMDGKEEALLTQRVQVLSQSQAQILLALLVLVAVALIVLIPLWWTIRREVLCRANIEAKASHLSNQLQSLLAAATEVSIISTDINGAIVLFNRGAENLLGYRAEELIGKCSSALFHDADEIAVRSAELSREFGRDIAGLEVFTTLPALEGHERRTWTYITKQGERIPVFLGATCIRDGSGAISGYLSIALDLREQRQLEQSLRAARDVAERASEAKGNFLATMSHEIRTPLTGMLGMMELLMSVQMEKGQQAKLSLVWESSKHLLRIVNDILDWSKIEEGKLVLSPNPTAIAPLLRAVTDRYVEVASSKGLVLFQHADARLHAAHRVDALRLSQVLNNFVSNAIKFTEQGEVELRAERLSSDGVVERIRFSVRDTGVGIDLAAQSQLFQRYQQESQDTARMYGGTGLGLAICKSLVDLMGGEIALDSGPGEGSTFSLTLSLSCVEPAATMHHLDAEVQYVSTMPLHVGAEESRPLILVVDDHPINREMLAHQIRYLGLRAEVAEDGAVALKMWRTGRYRLVITDCHMPEMDGYALARGIRQIEADEQRSATPIIAWTANALAEEFALCQAAGMDELLVKPVELPDLRSMLARWLPIKQRDGEAIQVTTLASGATSQVIDYARLNMMVPDAGEQRRALEAFEAHLSKECRQLDQYTDLATIASIAHRMKGACLMVGAEQLVAACNQMEQAAMEVNWHDTQAAIAEFEQALARVSAHIQAGDAEGEPS